MAAKQGGRPTRRMIAGLLVIVGVICAVTLFVFARGQLAAEVIPPVIGLCATLILGGALWFALETVLKSDPLDFDQHD